MSEPLDLDKITAYCDAATAGGWFYNGYSNVCSVLMSEKFDALPDDCTEQQEYEVNPVVCEVPCLIGDEQPEGSRQQHDAIFCAKAHTDLPLAVAELRAARERGGALETVLFTYAVNWHSMEHSRSVAFSDCTHRRCVETRALLGVE